KALTPSLSRWPSRIAWNEPKSRPAQKSWPSPESTTARTPGSDRRRSPVLISPANMAISSALRFSGRASRTSATPSVISTVTRRSAIAAPPGSCCCGCSLARGSGRPGPPTSKRSGLAGPVLPGGVPDDPVQGGDVAPVGRPAGAGEAQPDPLPRVADGAALLHVARLGERGQVLAQSGLA